MRPSFEKVFVLSWKVCHDAAMNAPFEASLALKVRVSCSNLQVTLIRWKLPEQACKYRVAQADGEHLCPPRIGHLHFKRLYALFCEVDQPPLMPCIISLQQVIPW